MLRSMLRSDKHMQSPWHFFESGGFAVAGAACVRGVAIGPTQQVRLRGGVSPLRD